jgi:hypothetical protein
MGSNIMPTDVIHPNYHAPEATRDRDAEALRNEMRVEVHWTAGPTGYLQVASTVPNAGGSKLIGEMIQDGLRAIGASPLAEDALDLVRQALDNQCGPGGFDGWHATLYDRRAVNALIRSIRKARDASFGRDE